MTLSKLTYALGVVLTLPLLPFWVVGLASGGDFVPFEDPWFGVIAEGLMFVLFVFLFPVGAVVAAVQWVKTGTSWLN